LFDQRAVSDALCFLGVSRERKQNECCKICQDNFSHTLFLRYGLRPDSATDIFAGLSRDGRPGLRSSNSDAIPADVGWADNAAKRGEESLAMFKK
jgi:hypothetical protein